MTEPTDAELLEVIREAARGGAVRRDGSTSLRISRAVLAKWGTPPVAREPLSDELLAKKAHVGPVHDEYGVVTRRPTEYREELERQFRRGFRSAEKHYGITKP